MKEIELLSPVGKMEALYAAIQNGANAVYLGGKLFNARHYASNFEDEELKVAVDYAHLRDVKVYVTMNTVLDELELEAAVDYAKFLYDIGVDALIIQDLGLAYLLKNTIPDLDLHGSTQMTVNNVEGADFLYKNGFKRIVLARETPIKEIRKINEKVPIELEVFIHGALCVSYSGQCLMSSMIGGRSGNRGRCAQPCRMPSSLIDGEGKSIRDWKNKHILSPKDLSTVEEINELIDAGVLSLKIEGRMKRPEYVATVTRVYRKAIDFGSEHISEKDKTEVKQIFNRGFTKGLTFKDFGKDFITYDRPDNRGLFLGTVVQVGRDTIALKLEKDLSVGDGIEFQFGQDNYKGMKSEAYGKAGELVELKKIASIKLGQEVYKTSSIELLETARESYEEDSIKKDIDIKVSLELASYPRIELNYGDKVISYSLDEEVQASKNKPLDRERVIEQISKMGDTVYNIRNIDIDMDDNIFMPLSSLNKLRREVVQKLDEYILDGLRKPELRDEDFKLSKEAMFLSEVKKENMENTISIKVDSFEKLQSLDVSRVDRIYLNMEEIKEIDLSIKELQSYSGEVYLSTEKILYTKELENLKNILDKIKDDIVGVSVSNMGTLNFIRENYDLKLHGDTGLNAYNSFAIRFLKENGISSINLSPELNLKQISRICKKTDIEVSTIVYGYLTVMVTKHCPMSLVKGCKDDSNCKNCRFRYGYSIKDRIGAEFKMVRKSGVTNIYNPVPIMILDDMDSLIDSGINDFRLDFSFEKASDEILNKYVEVVNDEISIRESKEFVEKFKGQGITKGHYFRGILD